jgi:hypothetical protein
MKTTTLKPVALATALFCASAAVQAGETIEFENGVNLDWRVTNTYSLAQRLKAPDPLLAGNAGSNDGNNNFKKGGIVNNRLSALIETKLYKGETGFVLSGTTFYDDVYHRSTDNTGAVNYPGPSSQFSSAAKRFHGGYSRFLDAYGYTSFDLGESRATVKLGRHVVNWGEALFFPNISFAQGPFDGTKNAPGTETKDVILPEDQISLSVELNPRTSLLGQIQYGFNPTIAPAPGTYLNSSDAVGPGGSCLGPFASIPAIPGLFGGFNGCSFGNNLGEPEPKDTQWGIGLRHRITDETEVGVYFMNYHERSPIPVINAFTPGTAIPGPLQAAFGGITQIGNGSYTINYFDNVKLLGATVSTSIGKISAYGEFTYREGAPALVDTVVNPATGATIPNPTRANVSQLNIGGFSNMGRTPLAPSTLVLGELSVVNVSGVKPIKAPGVQALGPAAAFFPESSNLSFKSNTGVALSTTLALQYPGIFSNWDLAIPISYSHQLKGRTLFGGVGGEGDRRISIGASMTYDRNLSLGLTYVNYMGDASTDLKTSRLLTDRDYIAFTMKYAF